MSAQTTTDPTLGDATVFDATLDPLLRDVFEAIWAVVRSRPRRCWLSVSRWSVVMVILTCAERERAAAATGVPADWALVGDTLVEAVSSVLLAPLA